MTIKKEGKVKLMEAKGDLAWVASELGISEGDADALRTYEQFHFDMESPIIKAIDEGISKAVKLVEKHLEGESQAIVSQAVKSLTAKLPSLIVSGQNEAVISVREIPRIATVKTATSTVAPEEVSGI